MYDGGQRYQASEAMAPFDLAARANAAARLAYEPAQVDLRVTQHSPVSWPSATGTSSVSMRDMLGASLITYEQHLDMASARTTASSWYMQDSPTALEPKAVYVQYHSHDPVTGDLSPVVVPATMSLDVFADPNWFGPPQEEEKVAEEEKDDNEEEDRQKLRSSIKGDPILMRAKPAPPPDPYFAPQRHENLLPKLCGANAVGPLFASSGSTPCGQPTPMVMRHVEGCGTMSSFLKASGKDKYSRSRITEIDQILKAASPREQADPSSPVRTGVSREGFASPRTTGSRPSPSAWGSPRSAPAAARCGSGMRDADTGALTAQMAMYIQRMPQFHKGKLTRLAHADAGGVDHACLEGIGDGGGNAGTGAVSGEEDLDGGRRSPGSQPEGSLPSPPSTAPAAIPGHSPRGAARAGQRSSSTRGGGQGAVNWNCVLKRGKHPGQTDPSGGARALAKQKLRDLDPHIDISASVPTQRLHCNWPEGQRRQLARHFYGLTPAQILEEEEDGRLREQGAVQRKKDPTADEGDMGADKDSSATDANEESAVDETRTAKAKARREAERRGLERSFARTADGGQNFHRLEIRIRNVNRPERVVVGRPTGGDESKFRKCVLLDSLQASRMGFDMK